MKILVIGDNSESIQWDLIRKVHENPKDYEPITEPDPNIEVDRKGVKKKSSN